MALNEIKCSLNHIIVFRIVRVVLHVLSGLIMCDLFFLCKHAYPVLYLDLSLFLNTPVSFFFSVILCAVQSVSEALTDSFLHEDAFDYQVMINASPLHFCLFALLSLRRKIIRNCIF